ncbi:MAG: Rieske 2Fe-2S domain-containing protein [Acidimicrobiia bacterium]
MAIAIGIVVVLVLAVVALLVTGRRRATTGRLSRETRQRDAQAGGSEVPAEAAPEGEETVDELSDEARTRADDARRAIESGSSLVPEVAGAKAPVRYEPVDEEELGVSRRQFFNRSILTVSGLGLGAFGVASIAFLWPSATGGAGTKITVGSEADAKAAFDNKEPFYNAGAKTYIVEYPKADLAKARKVPTYAPVLAGMEQGYVALYQKCVHLGCRVPWCASSQWFECPCHGSKYNRVGEKRGGPAPRGLDRFVLEVQGGDIVVDTATVIVGPPIGTDTTGQSPEGAPCV